MSELDIEIADIIAQHQARRLGLSVEQYIAKLVLADYMENKERYPVKKRSLDQSVQWAYERWAPGFKMHLQKALQDDTRVQNTIIRSMEGRIRENLDLYTNERGEFLNITEWAAKIKTPAGEALFLKIHLAGEATLTITKIKMDEYLKRMDE